MDLVAIDELFEVSYGTKVDFNKTVEDPEGINFVTRSRRSLGISARVKKIPGIDPIPPGKITVTLGGSYLLSCFVQPKEFYSAQNIKVLTPKEPMAFNEKVFYCNCISRNRFRYSSHGREANRSLNSLLVPSRKDIPDWVSKANISSKTLNSFLMEKSDFVMPQDNHPLRIKDLFDTKRGINVAKYKREDSKLNNFYIPIIRPSKTQVSSFVQYIDRRHVDVKHVYPAGTLYVSTNGQGSHTFAYVSTFEFVPNSDVTVLIEKGEKLNTVMKLFIANAISKNRPLFSYGRKPKGLRLENLELPNKFPKFVVSPKGPFQSIG